MGQTWDAPGLSGLPCQLQGHHGCKVGCYQYINGAIPHMIALHCSLCLPPDNIWLGLAWAIVCVDTTAGSCNMPEVFSPGASKLVHGLNLLTVLSDRSYSAFTEACVSSHDSPRTDLWFALGSQIIRFALYPMVAPEVHQDSAGPGRRTQALL